MQTDEAKGRKLALLVGLLFCSCGTAVPQWDKTSSTSAGNGPFYIAQFSPGTSAVAALPTTVVVAFNRTELNRGLLGVLTFYNLSCAGVEMAAERVDSVSGYGSATITLPNMGMLAPGTSCVFTVSSHLLDADGNSLSGARTATYTIL